MPTDNEIASLLKSAFAKRENLRAVTNAIRLVNGRGDGLSGLIIEQYDTHFVAQVFERPVLEKMDLIAGVLRTVFNPRYFICKDRSQSGAALADAINSKVLIDQGCGSKGVVQEFGIKFNVDLNDGLNVGLFLDMRHNRQLVAQLALGGRVLNCFAYTCSFGLHARKAKALEVINVDVSKRILERAAANYALNDIVPSSNEFVRADATEYLARAVKRDNRFDLIILDPPSFARSDKNTFQVKRDLPNVLVDALKVLNPNGTIFVSTNFNGIADTDLIGMLKKAAGGRTIKNVERLGQDKDFIATNTFKESYLAAICATL